MNDDNSPSNSDSASDAPPSGKTIGSEAWWDVKPSCRSTAAYKAGRLFSQLQWLSQIAFLRTAPRDEELANRVLDRLAELSHDLCPDSLGLIDLPVAAARKELTESWNCERAANDRQAANEQCYWDTRDQLRGQYCEDLLKIWVTPCARRLRSAIRRTLGPEETACFELGEHLDHGIRRPDFYDMDAPLRPMSDIPDSVDVLLSEKKPRSPRDELQRNHLMPWIPEPGTLPPPGGWHRRLLRFAFRAGMPQIAVNDVLGGMTKLSSDDSSSITLADVDRIDGVFWAHLDCRGESADSAAASKQGDWAHTTPPPEGQFPFGPVVGSLSQLAHWVAENVKTLRNRNASGTLWVMKHHSRRYSLWLSNETEYELVRQGVSDSERKGTKRHEEDNLT